MNLARQSVCKNSLTYFQWIFQFLLLNRGEQFESFFFRWGRLEGVQVGPGQEKFQTSNLSLQLVDTALFPGDLVCGAVTLERNTVLVVKTGKRHASGVDDANFEFSLLLIR